MTDVSQGGAHARWRAIGAAAFALISAAAAGAFAEGLQVQSADNAFEGELKSVRASRADLNVRPSRWDTRSTLAKIEALLSDPLDIPAETERWSRDLRQAESSADLVYFAAQRLGVSLSTAPPEAPSDGTLRREREIPPLIRPALIDLLRTISRAQQLVNDSVASLSLKEREAALTVLGAALRHEEETERLDGGVFDAMARYRRTPLLQAAYELAAAADRAIPLLTAAAPTLKEFAPRRWSTPSGDVLISGASDRAYSQEDVQNVALLIHMGGDSRYSGPVAAAHAGQIRIVIDLGENVVIDGAGGSCGGSGIFGIGLLYLPNAAGAKVITAQDFSLGAGLFGVGGLFVNGSSMRMEGAHFSQGAGAYGIGILKAKAPDARYSLRFAGQGFGYTEGAGLFAHHGDNARIEGGLFYPDPREPLAAISLAQGVGYGPRAFAAGGVGLALLEGNKARLNGSYFAQGSGYWHGLGGLFVFGDENRLQARRYDQGAGIHTAIGVLHIEGDKNQTVNWGVGPAFGWDFGVGAFTMVGDDGSLQADWSAGHGDYAGHALALIRGSRNQFSLPDFGTGGLTRGAPSYGMAIISGERNRFRWNHAPLDFNEPFDFSAGPWGVLRGEGSLRMDPDAAPPKAEWPRFDRDEAMRKEINVMEGRLRRAGAEPMPQRIADLLSIASSFGLASGASGNAALAARGVDRERHGQGSVSSPAASAAPGGPVETLLSLDDEGLAQLSRLLSSDYFDEYIWLRTFLASYGRRMEPEVEKIIGDSQGLRKSLAVGLFSTVEVHDALPVARANVADPDWRVRRSAVGVLGYLLSRETGEESGRRTLLRAALETFPKNLFSRSWNELLNQKRLSDLYGLLALDPDFSAEDRIELMEKAENPYDPVGPEGIAKFARMLDEHKKRYREVFSRELQSSEALEGQARGIILTLLSDADADVKQSALTALGQIGNPEDIAAVAPFLSHDGATLRETAALALAKMGAPAKPALEEFLKTPNPRTRALAALAAAQSPHRGVLKLLRTALDDREPDVRRTAAAALCRIQAPFGSYRKKFLKKLAELETTDPSSSVRAAAAYAKVLIPR